MAAQPVAAADVAVEAPEEFPIASLLPEGSNYDQRAWVYEPGQEYHYSVSAYPFLRYLVGQVTGQSYAEYMHVNVFVPLGMTSSGFSAEEFAGRHAIPYTRIDGKNIELPIWNGQGSIWWGCPVRLKTYRLSFPLLAIEDQWHARGRRCHSCTGRIGVAPTWTHSC